MLRPVGHFAHDEPLLYASAAQWPEEGSALVAVQPLPAQPVQLVPPDARSLCFPLPQVMHAAALPCKLQRPGLVSFSELRGAVRCGVQQALAYGKR